MISSKPTLSPTLSTSIGTLTSSQQSATANLSQKNCGSIFVACLLEIINSDLSKGYTMKSSSTTKAVRQLSLFLLSLVVKARQPFISLSATNLLAIKSSRFLKKSMERESSDFLRMRKPHSRYFTQVRRLRNKWDNSVRSWSTSSCRCLPDSKNMISSNTSITVLFILTFSQENKTVSEDCKTWEIAATWTPVSNVSALQKSWHRSWWLVTSLWTFWTKTTIEKES